jgi:hypothetical protein
MQVKGITTGSYPLSARVICSTFRVNGALAMELFGYAVTGQLYCPWVAVTVAVLKFLSLHSVGSLVCIIELDYCNAVVSTCLRMFSISLDVCMNCQPYNKIPLIFDTHLIIIFIFYA